MPRSIHCHIVYILVTAVALSAISTPAAAKVKHLTVTAPDGVELAVQVEGDPNDHTIIFIHGLLGSHLNWKPQLKSAKLQQYRLVTYDLRGHGLSGKPTATAAYRNGRRWADDLAAIIEAVHARNPILVGWSLGGTVISNYLAAYGASDISGAVYVDGVIELKPNQITPHPKVYRKMASANLKTHTDGVITFLRLCFYNQPDPATFDHLLVVASMASWNMMRAVQSMSVAASQGLSNAAKADLPVLLIYGAQDALVKPKASIAQARELYPQIQSKLYANTGHAAFLEKPKQFNHDIAAFVNSVLTR